jgi:hypothetical protein
VEMRVQSMQTIIARSLSVAAVTHSRPSLVRKSIIKPDNGESAYLSLPAECQLTLIT